MHYLNELVPYLAGAASALAAQFLIQVFVDPRADSRKRRDERWEKDVIDLGDLLSGPLRDAARKVHSEQLLLLGVCDFPAGTMDPLEKREMRERAISEQKLQTRRPQSTEGIGRTLADVIGADAGGARGADHGATV